MLTLDQQKWIDHLSDTDLIHIFPFDPTSEEKFLKVKSQVQATIGHGFEVLHRGASALGISGQKELDIYIPVSAEEMFSLAQKMEKVFGKPKSIYPERIKFYVYVDGTRAEVILYDKNHPSWTKQEKFFQFLMEDSQALNAYKKLKEESDALSVREYYRRKVEFINDIMVHL